MSIDQHVKYDTHFAKYTAEQEIAIEMVQSISYLIQSQSVELVLFRNPLRNISVSKLLKLHAQNLAHPRVDVRLTAALAKLMEGLSLCPATIDVGKLALRWQESAQDEATMVEFLRQELDAFCLADQEQMQAQDVALFGFGRIGRLLCRQLIKQAGRGQQLRLKAIVLRQVDAASLYKRAGLLSSDSVHGDFDAIVEVDVENKTLLINGQLVQIIEANSPEVVDYEAYGLKNALIIDNTGAFRSQAELSRHLVAKGAGKVVLTAPGKDFKNTVFGVNHERLELESERIFSAASCTTNAISPVLDVLQEEFGVRKGHVETIHAYTNDQNLLDNMHSKNRRGRSAATNMVITSTGAGKAVAQVIPSLAGKLTSNAVRVPTPNGSLAILQLELEKEVTSEMVNQAVKSAAQEGKLVNQINYSVEPDLVSSDIIGNDCCSVFDSQATLVSPDGRSVVLYVWYDNEHGYTMQVMRVAKYVSHVFRPVY